MIPCQNSKVMGLLSFEQQLPQISEPKLMRAIEYQPQSPLRVQKECYGKQEAQYLRVENVSLPLYYFCANFFIVLSLS